MPQRRPGLTVHCRIRNEEYFVRAAIESVLPAADHVLVYDTGSTDRTLDEIAAIDSPKIELVHRPPGDARVLARYRNEMIDRTQTEWYMILDGDEIYPSPAAGGIRLQLDRVPQHVHRVVVNRVHFVENFNFVSMPDGIGRLFRTSRVRQGFVCRRDGPKVGHETPYLAEAPTTPWSEFSVRWPSSIFFFHCQYLRRSSKDAELGRLRGWRKPPVPVVPFFGPWPETLNADSVARSMTPALLLCCTQLNTTHVWRRLTGPRQPIPVLWRMKPWPPRDVMTFDGNEDSPEQPPSALGSGQTP